MPRLRFFVPLVAACCLVLASRGWAQSEPDPSRDVMLQTVGMLAGQGLVLGYESLEGLYVRYEKRAIPRDKAQLALAAIARYADLVLATFKDRLMVRLNAQEQKDMALLIGFYELQRQAIEALSVYIRSGGTKNRENFQSLQERMAAVIQRISLAGGAQP